MSDDENVLQRRYGRGRRRLHMIQDLAASEMTKAEVAAKYGISETATYQFINRNKEDIERAQASLTDALMALWIANKYERIAANQGYVEILEELTELVENEKVPAILKTASGILRNVAEELGHLSPKDGSEVVKVDVHLHGVDGDV